MQRVKEYFAKKGIGDRRPVNLRKRQSIQEGTENFSLRRSARIDQLLFMSAQIMSFDTEKLYHSCFVVEMVEH